MQFLDYLSLTWRPGSGPDALKVIPKALFLFLPLPPRLGLQPPSLSPPLRLIALSALGNVGDLAPQQMKQAAAL